MAVIIEKSLKKNRGLLIKGQDLVEVYHIANFIALELSVEHLECLLEYIHHAGTFL